MNLHLIDGSVVKITRLTCCHYTPDQYGRESCNWNINPVQIVNNASKGYFAIGEMGLRWILG